VTLQIFCLSFLGLCRLLETGRVLAGFFFSFFRGKLISLFTLPSLFFLFSLLPRRPHRNPHDAARELLRDQDRDDTIFFPPSFQRPTTKVAYFPPLLFLSSLFLPGIAVAALALRVDHRYCCRLPMPRSDFRVFSTPLLFTTKCTDLLMRARPLFFSLLFFEQQGLRLISPYFCARYGIPRLLDRFQHCLFGIRLPVPCRGRTEIRFARDLLLSPF